MTDVLDYLYSARWDALDPAVQERVKLCLLDLLATGIVGSGTTLSRIIRNHVAGHMGGAVQAHIPFDGRSASPAGVALAHGMTIDSVDAHDGWNPVKGHIGCGLMPAVLAVAQAEGALSGADFLATLAAGYEVTGRLGDALHGTVPDYHTSGAWVAVGAAACAARVLGLTRDQARHAMGIAEYHGPRSQMMRCIDHPTMLKDGSGYGSMAGVTAAYLAQAGFTGAPAITAEGEQAAPYFQDMESRSIILEQYFKPYPICRWAQAPVEGVLALATEYGLSSHDVDHIEVGTFHEAVRLATNDPKTTEEAQYSTSYPCAVALVRGTVGLWEVSPEAFHDPEVQRLSKGLQMVENEEFNRSFPIQRHAKVKLHLRDGRVVSSDTTSPRWTAENPPTPAELRAKFHTYADPLLGEARAARIEGAVDRLDQTDLGELLDAVSAAP
ncbi:MAG: MmgE/PrpD family protein [Pseudomonadota bacterium]